MLQMITQAIANGLIFKYVIADSWYASAANMRFINQKKKFFVFDMQSNRLAALNEQERKAGKWTRIDELKIPNNEPVSSVVKRLGNSRVANPTILYKQRAANRL